MLGFSVGKLNVGNHVPISIVLSVFKLVKIDVESCLKMFRTWFSQLIIGFAQSIIAVRQKKFGNSRLSEST